jgi:hypothetical protein
MKAADRKRLAAARERLSDRVATNQPKQIDREYQTYGVDSDGHVVHAGVNRARRMSPEIARKIQRKWLIWRAGYLANHPGQYPLRDSQRVVRFCMHPVDDPSQARSFVV